MSETIRVYIASPYTLGDAVLNVRRSLEAADDLLSRGYVPFVPLLAHFWHFLSPKDYRVWTAYDLAWVPVCDALLRLSGESEGADREVEEAREHGVPVFFDVETLANEMEVER